MATLQATDELPNILWLSGPSEQAITASAIAVTSALGTYWLAAHLVHIARLIIKEQHVLPIQPGCCLQAQHCCSESTPLHATAKEPHDKDLNMKNNKRSNAADTGTPELCWVSLSNHECE